MKLPSGDCRCSRVKVRGSGCEMKEFRRVEGGGSNGGTIEVVGEGGCENIEFRWIEGGGSNVGTIGVVGGGGCEKINFDVLREVDATEGQLRLLEEVILK